MPYNSYFPVGYQPTYYQQPQYAYQNQAQTVPSVQPTQPQAQQMTSGIIWVQGEAGAKSYLVAPNTTVQLWDSEENVIYIKTADSSGMPSMKILDYTIRESNSIPKPKDNIDYVTKTEFQEMKSGFEQTIDEMQSTINQMKQARQSKSASSNGLG